MAKTLEAKITWIKSGERYPQFGDKRFHHVLVTQRHGDVDVALWTDEGGWNTYYDLDGSLVGNGMPDEWIEAWSYFPEPYREEG